ncbi:MAG: class I SAM-dependent methyltransferase [Rhodospirillales bacterium]|nr:class I SAM-dependent methyltransferase [Rhodospirillales bacterium]
MLIPRRPSQELPGLGPEAYAAWRGSGIGLLTERLERRLILELLGGMRGKSVLEIGCGDGDLALDLARRGARVVGIDSSPRMIAAARARAEAERGEAEFLVAAAAGLPFASARFDLVVAVTILCFVADARPVFAEIARVLRPGGRLVIGELGRWNSWAAVRRVRAWSGSALWRGARFRTPAELAALARGAGLAPGPVRGAIYFPRWLPAGRLLAPLDHRLGRLTPFGAAFLALAASRPPAS